MRSVLILAVFAVNLVHAAGNDYEEVRELSLGTRGIDMFKVQNGSGSINIAGVSGTDEISVTATIVVPGKNAEKARRKIEDGLVLKLEQDHETGVLKAHFRSGGGFISFGESPSVNLDIRMPENLQLEIDDGSGSIEIHGVLGDIALDDGSGSITMVNVGGNIEIDDGSGSIAVQGVGGDININDGSGGMSVRGVSGSVTVDDGSGNIEVSDVEKDLVIIDDGSGDLDYSNISGRVVTDF